MTTVAMAGAISDMQRAELLDVLRHHSPPLEAVHLYGSRANGTARRGSDIDIVLVGPIGDALLRTIAGELDESYVSVPVDVSAYATMRPGPFREEVLATARPLFDLSDLTG